MAVNNGVPLYHYTAIGGYPESKTQKADDGNTEKNIFNFCGNITQYVMLMFLLQIEQCI